MKLMKLILPVMALLSLPVSGAQAWHRHHRSPSYAKASAGRHGPRVSFGFNVGMPVYRPVYVAPCHGYCRPVLAPVVYAAPYVRPSFGVSFGSGPVNFGFGF